MKTLCFPPHGTTLCPAFLSDVLQVRNTLITMVSPVSCVLKIFIICSLSLCHSFLKDAELSSSNPSSLKTVEEPQEPLSPEAMEIIQVTDFIYPCLGPGGAGEGALLVLCSQRHAWCWLITEF